MKLKGYDFRYKSKSQKANAVIMNSLGNFFMPIFICSLIMCAPFSLGYGSLEYYLILFTASILVGIILCVKYNVSYKGVILYDDYLSIERNGFTDRHLKMNISIPYNQISSVYNSRIKMDYKQKRNALLLGGDDNYYVEIVLIGGKVFNFSVEDQEAFVSELIERVEIARKQN